MAAVNRQDAEAYAEEADELVQKMRPMFAGKDPMIVGAVLGQLLALLIAGYHPGMRDEQFDLLIGLVRNLVPQEIEGMIASGRAGPEWRGMTRQ